MTTTMLTRRRRTLMGALVAVALLGACGGGDDDGDAGADPTDETTDDTVAETTTTADPAAEEEAVGTVLTDFFAKLGAGDLEGGAALLENGDSYLDRMAHCEALTTGASIEMQTVEFLDPETASATFDILLNGAVALEGAGGGAVKVDGEWMVSENTFLSLYDAAKDSCTGPPPADA